MKKHYAIIHVHWDGVETFKVVPFERIDAHGKQLIYDDIWMLPGENARSRTLSTAGLIALAEDMGNKLSFHTIEEEIIRMAPRRRKENVIDDTELSIVSNEESP